MKNKVEKTVGWDMSQERVFVENLLVQRFNFFLIFFSIVVTGSLSTESSLNFKIILFLGAIICWLLSVTIIRAQTKFDLIFDELLKDDKHPISIIDKRCPKKGSARRLIGYIIPILCASTLTIEAILAFFNVLVP